MRIHLAALRGALRGSSLQDAGLAALLLAGTWAVHGADASWLRQPPARGALIAVGAAAATGGRRGPIPALAAAWLAAMAQMALAAGPVPTDLAVPIILYT